MGRGRAKGKKLSVTNQDDPGSGEEEKIPAQKKRGRPQKPLKDEIDEDSHRAQKIGDEDSEDTTTGMLNKEIRGSNATQNGNKRKKNGQLKEKADSLEDGNENGTRSSTEDSNKSNGYRQARNRRKNKPCRAAEVGVDSRLF